MHLIRSLRRTGLVFAAGATTAYYLDPEAGPERRSRVLEQLSGLVPDRTEDAASEETAAMPSSPPHEPSTPDSQTRPFADSQIQTGSASPDDHTPAASLHLDAEAGSLDASRRVDSN